MFFEIIKFIVYSGLIVLISKYILVITLRKLAISLELKPKTVGNIAGYATSMPELLTISISSINGLINTSVFNILSSNIINFIQYLLSIILNKNKTAFTNKAIRIDVIMVLITIVIPVFLVWKKIEISLWMVPAFLILYSLFKFLNYNAHNQYLSKEETTIKYEEKKETKNTRKIFLYILILIVTSVLLYIIGELLGNTLNNLCNQFQISQTIIGILLGFITSIPELITFFEAQKHHKKQENNEMLGVVEATNNLLTSNVLNLFVIQSLGIMLFYI